MSQAQPTTLSYIPPSDDTWDDSIEELPPLPNSYSSERVILVLPSCVRESYAGNKENQRDTSNVQKSSMHIDRSLF